MAVELEPWEREIVLEALWNLKLDSGRLHATTEALSSEELGRAMSSGERIDQVAVHLGGDPAAPVYGVYG